MSTDASREDDPEIDWQELNRIASPLIDVLTLAAVRTIRAEVELIDSEVAERIAAHRTVSTADIEASRAPGQLAYKVSHEDVFTDDAGVDGARVAVEIVVAFHVKEEFEETQEQVEAVAAALVSKIIHPYYREAVSSLLGRVGIHGLTVGLIKFPSNEPEREMSD